MHPALEIPEIFLDIFHHCCPLDASEEHRLVLIPDLASLARTCRTFKEPALDLLWGVLIDLSPLVRCRPEKSQRTAGKRNLYSFTKLPTSEDWDIIHSYTRRVRTVYHFTRGLDRKSIKILSGAPSTTDPLFPNLRVLRYEYAEGYIPLSDLPLPPLSSLFIQFSYSHLAGTRDLPVSLPKLCPDVRALSFRVLPPRVAASKLDSSHFCRWQNLQSVECPDIFLDADALVHLSRMPALTTLNLGLNNTSSTPDSTLTFFNVLNLTLNSRILDPISRFLSQSRLPAITNFTTRIHCGSPKQDLAYFFSCIETSIEASTIQTFSLTHPISFRLNPHHRQGYLVDFDDLRPCLAWCNLRHMEFDIGCKITLTDRDVFTLASAWPQLQNLLINAGWGWGPQSPGSGITLDGFIRLLQTCRSLSQIAVVLDVQGYTGLPSDHAPERLELMLPPTFSVNVIDSSIRAENVTAIDSPPPGITAGSELSFWLGDRKNYMEVWDVSKRVITITTTIP